MRWDQYHDCQPYPGNCHLCTEISKRRTIMQATVFQLQKNNSCRDNCLMKYGIFWSK